MQNMLGSSTIIARRKPSGGCTVAIRDNLGRRERLLGESQNIGTKRAIMDVLANANTRRVALAFDRAAQARDHADLLRAADELGITL